MQEDFWGLARKRETAAFRAGGETQDVKTEPLPYGAEIKEPGEGAEKMTT